MWIFFELELSKFLSVSANVTSTQQDFKSSHLQYDKAIQHTPPSKSNGQT